MFWGVKIDYSGMLKMACFNRAENGEEGNRGGGIGI